MSASLVLALALVLVLALRRWAEEPAPAVAPAPAAGPVAPRAIPVHGGAAARVQGELAELRAEVSRLGAAPAPEPAEALSPEEEQARGDQRVAEQTALLAKAFAADVRDPGWSPQTESALREAFAAAAVPGARLEEVACGGTLCRVTVAFDSIERRDEGVGAVAGLVRWDAIGFGDASPDDPLRYVVYASRDRESFPAVP
ncbi:MAG TPA: hypothetical protein VK932_13520 [Kofleriaceae bacterium]|nr:hypothetical protein [Kofleriaceae bacterium]